MRVLITAGLLFLAHFSYAQCAMCRAVADGASEDTGGSLGEGLNNGIIYLIIVTYVILFFLFRKRIVKFIKELNNMERG